MSTLVSLVLLCFFTLCAAYKAGDVVCTKDTMNIRNAPCGSIAGPSITPGMQLAVVGGPVHQCCFGGCYDWIQVSHSGQVWLADFGVTSCKTLNEVGLPNKQN
jgi:hypothetical protein